LEININFRASLLACSAFLLIILPAALSAQIFKVDKTQFLTVTSGLLAIDLSNNYLDEKFIEKPSAADLISLDKDDVPFFDQIAFQPYSKSLKDWSDYTAIAAIGIATYTAFDHDYWMDNLMVFSEIMLAQSAFAKWTKTFSSRYRPFVYDAEVSDRKKREYNSQHSFYSMHSSTTFAASTFAYYYYSQNFGKSIPTALLLYSPSVATAVLRVASANHFPSDVVTGAVIGSGFSYLICRIHRSDTVVINLGFNNIGFSIKY